MQKILLVLAGGMGNRFGGFKQIKGVGPSDELIIDYSVYDAMRAGFTKAVFVINRAIEKQFLDKFFNKIKTKINAEYVIQDVPDWRIKYNADGTPEKKDDMVVKKPLGTTHAVLVAKKHLDAPFCVIAADDFYGTDAFAKAQNNTVIGYRLDGTLSPTGAVNRGVLNLDKDKNVVSISEDKCERKGDKIVRKDGDKFVPLPNDTLASMCMFCLDPKVIPLLDKKMEDFLAVNLNDKDAECLLPVSLSQLINEGKISLKCVETTAKWFGFTYIQDLDPVMAEVAKEVRAGFYPTPLWGSGK
jgi:choline kinase